MLQGVSGAGQITHFETERFKTRIACELRGFDPLNYFDRKEVRHLDPFAQYGIVASDEAIKDSGIKDCGLSFDRIGVLWGSGFGGNITIQEECLRYFSSNFSPRFSPFFTLKLIPNICAGHIAIKHGFSGPNFSITAACASSAAAISQAFDIIRLGRASAMVVGGSEAAITETGIGGFCSMQALSTRNDDPLTASRPFDANRDGFVMGEGAAAIVLEEMEHAKQRNAKIYAELTGVGLSCDTNHLTAPSPQGISAAHAMELAVQESGMLLSDVDHINTHGTSTPIGDLSEARAIQQLFGDHAPKIALSATKSMTGHLLGAAGCLEAIFTVLSIKNGLIPPTINHFEDDPELPQLDYTFNKAAERPVQFALSNAFGFGGHNVCLAFRKFES